jgi:DNA-binding XRE family transcriptional regulator
MKSPAKPEPKARAVMGAPEKISADPSLDSGFEDSEPSESELSEPAGSELASAESSAAGSDPGSDADSEDEGEASGESKPRPKIRRDGESRGKKRQGLEPNNVRKLRQEAMMSKAELARRAGVSPLTIDRVEAGAPCRMDTKRKILEALGLKPSARTEVWPDIDAQS